METIDQIPQAQTPSRLLLAAYLKGGIGNQLFQYVAAASMARKMGADLVCDISFFGADPYQNKATVEAFAPGVVIKDVASVVKPGTYVLRDGLIASWQDQINLPADAQVLVTDGYWQRESLLDPAVVAETYANLAQAMRAVGEAPLAQEIAGQDDAVAVHLRRRDYAHMGVCEEAYYLGALDYLQKRFAQARVYVFSDEPNYARHFLGARYPNIVFVASGGDLSDLYLMSLCKHFVIANSTYSWWAAYFAERKGGLIVCPKEWVTLPGVQSPCPERWIQIENAVRAPALNLAAVEWAEKRVQRRVFDQAIREWFKDRGDQTLRVNFPELHAGSVVLDLGGYQGDWTHEIHGRYGAKVYVFEPIRQFADKISQRFAGVDAVKVCAFGLGARAETLELALSADGTGAFVSGSQIEQVEIREVQGFLAGEGIGHIDLAKINIEGAEFELLEHMIATGLIKQVHKLQVQFHDFVPDAVRRHQALVDRLSATHTRSWNYEFVWEEWTLN